MAQRALVMNLWDGDGAGERRGGDPERRTRRCRRARSTRGRLSQRDDLRKLEHETEMSGNECLTSGTEARRFVGYP